MENKDKKRPFRIIQGIKDRKIVKGSVAKEEYDSDFTSFDEPIIDDVLYCILFHEPEEDDNPDTEYFSICTEKHFINHTFGLLTMWALTDFDTFITNAPEPEKSFNSVIHYLTINEKFEDIIALKEKYKKIKENKE